LKHAIADDKELLLPSTLAHMHMQPVWQNSFNDIARHGLAAAEDQVGVFLGRLLLRSECLQNEA
jgi:hypothetical protein